MTGISPTPPVEPFYRSKTAKPVTVADISQMRSISCKLLSDLVGSLQPLVHDAVKEIDSDRGNQFQKQRFQILLKRTLCWKPVMNFIKERGFVFVGAASTVLFNR